MALRGRVDDETDPACLEDVEDSLVDGDRPYKPGSARAALAHREFRRIYFGAFASNIGTWMQNVVLAAWAFELTDSASFVGVIIFAQLGPLLLLSTTGGLLADALDRRRLLIVAQIEQMALSVVLAVLATADNPSLPLIVLVVFGIGMGQAINAPAWSAVIPTLVGRRDLPGAISLNSAQMNGSRVIGPAIGGLIFPAFGPAGVFSLNAVTYLVVIGALVMATFPTVERAQLRGQGLRGLADGFRFARRDPLVARCLVTITLFSLIALTFVGQMPVVASDNYGFDVRSFAYGVLYALFGLGAVTGSISIGTVFSATSKAVIVRWSLLLYACLLTPFALLSTPAAAFPLAFAVGAAYFAFITALSTVLQAGLDDAVRGRVMALWIMGFGGTVPVGNLIAGPIIEASSIRLVMVVGAATAVALAGYAWDLRRAGAQV